MIYHDIKNLIFKYNLKFIYKKVIWITFIMIIVCSFVILTNNSSDLTSVDLIIYSLGGYNVQSSNMLLLMIALFPNLMIAMLIERYISEMLEKNFMYVLIRIRNEKIYYIAHIISIAIIIALMLLTYDFIIFLFSITFGNSNVIGEHGIRIIGKNLEVYSLHKIIFNIFIVQFVGVYSLASLQMLLAKLTQKHLIGFIFTIGIYLLNISIKNFNSLGSHIVITKINVLSNQWEGQSIKSFIISNAVIIIMGLIIYGVKCSSKWRKLT